MPDASTAADRQELPVEPPNDEYSRSTLDAFTRTQLRLELLRGVGDPFEGDIASFWSWRANITSRINEIDPTPLDEVQILRANTRGKPLEIIKDLVVAGVESPRSTVNRIWTEFEETFGSESEP